ncbi:MAG: FIST C-terminal domain-containing protein [Candidatus Cloacimonetes bacterium]|nr:FIST C-terminal domain-containing protein [Candidatus Cloacimonadota bacterium]
MKIEYINSKETELLNRKLGEYENDNNIKGILLLACDANNYTADNLDPILKSVNKKIFGGIFPSIIFNNKKHETGFIIAGFEDSLALKHITNISSQEVSFDDKMIEIVDEYHDSKTMFVFVDGLTERINSFIESIFTIFGLEYNFIGGGAGSLTLKQKPCIITNSGLKQDCAVIAGIKLNSGIGVKHGWNSISGPYKVTSADKTVIKELDFKPAFEVYKEVVENHSGKSINSDNFYEIAKAYPFGINKIDTEKIVRDPLFTGNNNSLICVGEVETGYFVDILTGDKNTLIEAAGKAVKSAMRDKDGGSENFIFFIDCISRVLFLEDDFSNELEEVLSNNNKLPVFGALTLGEIANSKRDFLEFHNKTVVIGCF